MLAGAASSEDGAANKLGDVVEAAECGPSSNGFVLDRVTEADDGEGRDVENAGELVGAVSKGGSEDVEVGH